MLKKIACILFLLIVPFMLVVSGCGKVSSDTSGPDAAAAPGNGSKLNVQMLDVDQGDAILIRTGEQTILIDTGDDKIRAGKHKGENNNRLFEALDSLGITHIDKLIITHAHNDHMGLAAKVIKRYDVAELVYNGIPSANKGFRNMLTAANNKGVKKSKVKAGDVLDFGNDVSFKVLSPSLKLVEEDTKQQGSSSADEAPKINVNNESIVGRLTFGDFSMLLTGDAEKEIEQELLQEYGNELTCKVYKVSHHGSKTSSSKEFLQAIKPELAIISCGVDNQYGHPHKITMKKFATLGIKALETDLNGTITIESDGVSYSARGER